jgi:hypothetical protein
MVKKRPALDWLGLGLPPKPGAVGTPDLNVGFNPSRGQRPSLGRRRKERQQVR